MAYIILQTDLQQVHPLDLLLSFFVILGRGVEFADLLLLQCRDLLDLSQFLVFDLGIGQKTRLHGFGLLSHLRIVLVQGLILLQQLLVSGI